MTIAIISQIGLLALQIKEHLVDSFARTEASWP
jgi:hypothetical protein